MDHQPIIDLARRQHGAISSGQCAALGLSADQVRRLVSTGQWQRVRRGVYVVGAAAETFERKVMVAALAAGGDAIASGRTAAQLWGLVPASGRVELLVSGDRRVRLPGVTTRRSGLLLDEDRTHRFGIGVTSPVRTIVEASPGQTVEVIGQWIDAARRAEVLDLEALRRRSTELARPGRRSISALLAALELRAPDDRPGDSPLERWLLGILERDRLPAPVLQHPVALADGTTARIDAAYPRWKIALEADGFAFHSDRHQFDRDRARQSQLLLLGWSVHRFTSAMPEAEVAATVRAALAQAGCPIAPLSLLPSSPARR
jgi:very-short-patch-repair endonuclease